MQGQRFGFLRARLRQVPGPGDEFAVGFMGGRTLSRNCATTVEPIGPGSPVSLNKSQLSAPPLLNYNGNGQLGSVPLEHIVRSHRAWRSLIEPGASGPVVSAS